MKTEISLHDRIYELIEIGLRTGRVDLSDMKYLMGLPEWSRDEKEMFQYVLALLNITIVPTPSVKAP
jgi:hypothetical protein